MGMFIGGGGSGGGNGCGGSGWGGVGSSDRFDSSHCRLR